MTLASPGVVADRTALIATIRTLITQLGLDPQSRGLAYTPQRIADMYIELFEGLHQDPAEPLAVQFEEGHD